jgi:hypothetical protein
MCEEHSTSRHAFRTEAQVLVSQGPARQIPNRGIVVPEFGPEGIVDITRMRGANEGEAIRLIVLTRVMPPLALGARRLFPPTDPCWLLLTVTSIHNQRSGQLAFPPL